MLNMILNTILRCDKYGLRPLNAISLARSKHFKSNNLLMLLIVLLSYPISTAACSFQYPHVNIDTLKNSKNVKLTAISLKPESLMVSNKDVHFFLEYAQNARVVYQLLDSSNVWTDGYIWSRNSFWNANIDVERRNLIITNRNDTNEIVIPFARIDWIRTSVEEDKAQKARKWCSDVMISSFVGTGLLIGLIIYAAN